MPINIPDSLPAKKILEQENIFAHHSCFKSRYSPFEIIDC